MPKFTLEEYMIHVRNSALALHLAGSIMDSPTGIQKETPGSLIVSDGDNVVVLSKTSGEKASVRIEVEGTSPYDQLPKEAFFDFPLTDHGSNPLFQKSLSEISDGLGVHLLTILENGSMNAYEHEDELWTILYTHSSQEDEDIKQMIDSLCRPLSNDKYEVVQYNPALGSPAHYAFVNCASGKVLDQHESKLLADPVALRHLELAKEWSPRLGQSLMILPIDGVTPRFIVRRLAFSLARPDDRSSAIAAAHVAEMKLSAMALSKI
jgi:hypothetical protein